MEEKEMKILTCYHCENTGLMRVEGEYKTKRGGSICDEGDNQTDFYRYEVERATEFIGALIDYIYVLPNRIARFEQKVEEKLKEKTENQN